MNSSVNLTSSHTEEEERSDLDLVIVIFTSLILGLMILTTIIGKKIVEARLVHLDVEDQVRGIQLGYPNPPTIFSCPFLPHAGSLWHKGVIIDHSNTMNLSTN